MGACSRDARGDRAKENGVVPDVEHQAGILRIKEIETIVFRNRSALGRVDAYGARDGPDCCFVAALCLKFGFESDCKPCEITVSIDKRQEVLGLVGQQGEFARVLCCHSCLRALPVVKRPGKL
jgi:hypothetical protein